MTLSPLRLGGTLGAAWTWWIAELLALVPSRLRHWLSAVRGRHLLVIDETGADLVYEAGTRREKLERVAAGEQAPGNRSTKSRRRRHAEATIQLPARLGLRTVLTLPLAAADNLAQVIGFEVERHTPFRREEVHVAHRILARDGKARSIEVELSVAPRHLVEDALRLAESNGIAIIGAEIAASQLSLTPSPNLLSEKRPSSGNRVYRMVLGILAAIVTGLAVAAAVLPVYRAQQTADDLQRRIAAAKHQTSESAALQKKIDEAQKEAQFLVLKKRETPSVSEVLNTLSRLLPDDTWLGELQITQTEVQLSGYAASATALLGLLDDASGFNNAAFRSSVTQDTKLNREQFDISAKLKPRSGT